MQYKRFYITIVFGLMLFGTGFLYSDNPKDLSQHLLIVAISIVVLVITMAKKFLRLNEFGEISELHVLFGIFIWYIYPSLFHMIGIADNPIDIQFSVDQHSFLLFLIFNFLFFFYIAKITFFRKVTVNRVTPEYDSRRLEITALLFIFIGLTPIILLSGVDQVLARLLAGRDAANVLGQTSNLGNSGTFILVIFRSMLIAGVIGYFGALYANNSGPKRKLKWFFVFACAAFIALDSGTRSITMLILLPTIFCYLIRKKTSKRMLVIFFLIIIACIGALQLQLVYRTLASRENIEHYFNWNALILNGTIDFYVESLFAIHLVPTVHDFFYEFDPWLFVTLPIPRGLWPDKPVSDIVAFYTMQRWGQDIYTEPGNVFPGMIGQYYMSWGWWGVAALGATFGIISEKVDRKFRRILTSNDMEFNLALLPLLGISAWLLITMRYISPGFLVPILVLFLIYKIASIKMGRASWQQT